MDRLRAAGFVDPIRAWIAADRPFLGICLGLQLLFEGSDEDGAETLGVLPGPHGPPGRRPDAAPHRLEPGRPDARRTRAFDGIADGADFYFVHSYVGAPPAGDDADARSPRPSTARPFVSAVARGRMLGVQFHPERSGADGLRLIANVVGLAARARAAA